MDDSDAVIGLELELLQPACRANVARVEALLAEDFTEIGKSGRVWTRDEVIADLASLPAMDGITIGPMLAQAVAPGVMVVRYTTHHDAGPATVHRSGWWRQSPSPPPTASPSASPGQTPGRPPSGSPGQTLSASPGRPPSASPGQMLTASPGGWRCWFHQATVVPDRGGVAAVVARTDRPATQRDVETALRSIGVAEGSVVIVHSSLARLGWVVGAAAAVVHALCSVIGDRGTIVMPAQTGVSDPSHWRAPPVPEAWWPTIRSQWPAFDPALTPMRAMGAVAECFARLPGVVHSRHPAVGFVAHGPRAAELMLPHALNDGLGAASPLARLEAAGADIVLLGVGHGNNTALHLAEARALGEAAPMIVDGAPLRVDGRCEWVEYSHVDYDDSDFVALGDAYTAAGGAEFSASLGSGEIRRLPMPELLAFATRWLADHRSSSVSPPRRD